ncbi:MAG: phosphoribosylformylglycinamidine synthase subunit PurS [Proteobacteria bacterium]|nr:phosphoribosylformylglycinamidine synthase subunit PurS [Pseudomonadota bacterium]
MKLRVHVTPRRGVLDPQGAAVKGGLTNLGFDGIGEVRVGKVIDLTLASTVDAEAALALGRDMARKLLANETVEDFEVEVLG